MVAEVRRRRVVEREDVREERDHGSEIGFVMSEHAVRDVATVAAHAEVGFSIAPSAASSQSRAVAP